MILLKNLIINFFDVEIRLNDDNAIFQKIVIGTFKNSNNNRCILLGVQKNWKHLTKRRICLCRRIFL